MRILDEKTDQKLDKITIYLTKSEAIELRDSLIDLIQYPDHHHNHIPSDEYDKEITVCIYDDKNLSFFDERSKKLLKDDR